MFQFKGVSSLNLDAKGRVAMPARYRQQLEEVCGGRLVVTVDVNESRCLLVYPHPEWERVEEKVMRLPNSDPQVRWVQRLFSGYASECELDAQGRIRVAASLRERVGLDKRAVLVGQYTKFELWNEQIWNERSDLWMRARSESDEVHEQLRSITF